MQIVKRQKCHDEMHLSAHSVCLYVRDGFRLDESIVPEARSSRIVFLPRVFIGQPLLSAVSRIDF